jgi:hypothetical protein
LFAVPLSLLVFIFLGIPDNRIKTLVNDGADKRELLVSINNWLSRSVKQDQTDVYVFFAGHGLASDDGHAAFLLPLHQTIMNMIIVTISVSVISYLLIKRLIRFNSNHIPITVITPALR